MRAFVLAASAAITLAALPMVAQTAPASKPASKPVAKKVATVALADVIVTAAPEYAPLAAIEGGERFPKGARLELMHAGKVELLLTGFAASADAQVSYDGKRVLFAAKKTLNDPWRIFEMRLENRSVQPIIAAATDCIRPLYLPGGRLIFARKAQAGFEIVAAGQTQEHALSELDPKAGESLLVLTHIPASAVPVDVVADGRILFESKYPLGAGQSAELFLMYSDGSGVESYRCDHGQARWGGHQLASGDVVFTHGSALARFTSPMAHEVAIAAPKADYAGAVAETPEGAWLLSARAAGSSHFALKQWKPGAAVLQSLLADADANLLEPVIVAAHARPKQHPTALHPWSYANLLALDARLTREGELKTAPRQVRLETLDEKGNVVVNGATPVESDGSFFVQVPGDRPVRLTLLDENGKSIGQEHGWFWSRAGEQRYCVGCHTGPERGSENQVPQVLLKSIQPVNLTGAKPSDEKKSEGGGN